MYIKPRMRFVIKKQMEKWLSDNRTSSPTGTTVTLKAVIEFLTQRIEYTEGYEEFESVIHDILDKIFNIDFHRFVSKVLNELYYNNPSYQRDKGLNW